MLAWERKRKGGGEFKNKGRGEAVEGGNPGGLQEQYFDLTIHQCKKLHYLAA